MKVKVDLRVVEDQKTSFSRFPTQLVERLRFVQSQEIDIPCKYNAER